ncbi:unnamed protein product [Cylindrotheca closterium]|uniref:Uncharacterized protein n=1 Tax=Cylindrotheca closterium TaxID=2856 RepID=A0AAD2JNI1_9STRA|nr:unnamed protein product [Cylindrotheca closterium]
MSFQDLLQLEAMTDSFSDLSAISDANLISTTKDDITVFVSGQTFFMLPSLFEQVKGLQWYQVGGLYHLDAESDLFEIILQFFLVGSLPSKALVKKRKESLQQLVFQLGSDADELKMCVMQGGGSRKSHSRSPLSLKKAGLSLRSSSSNRKSPVPSSAGSSKKGFKSPFKRKAELSASDFVKLSNALLLDDMDGDSGSETGASTISQNSQKENSSVKSKKKWSLSSKPSTQEVHQSWCESEYIV